jgi:hypothetical protein
LVEGFEGFSDAVADVLLEEVRGVGVDDRQNCIEGSSQVKVAALLAVDNAFAHP